MQIVQIVKMQMSMQTKP